LETVEAMRIRLKYSAYIAALVTSPSGTLNALSLLNGAGVGVRQSDGSTVNETETKAGWLIGLPQGAEVKEMKTEFPAQQIQTFNETLVRDIANALNLSYGLIRDLSSLTGPGVRAVLAQDDCEFAMIRQNLMDRFLNPVRNRVLYYAACMGYIPASPFDPALYQGKWYFPSKLTIDVGREADADVKMNAAGYLTQDDINTDAQEYWQDVTYQLGLEAAYRLEVEKQLGLEPGTLRVLPFGPQQQTQPEGQQDGQTAKE
jgi:capsid protein